MLTHSQGGRWAGQQSGTWPRAWSLRRSLRQSSRWWRRPRRRWFQWKVSTYHIVFCLFSGRQYTHIVFACWGFPFLVGKRMRSCAKLLCHYHHHHISTNFHHTKTHPTNLPLPPNNRTPPIHILLNAIHEQNTRKRHQNPLRSTQSSRSSRYGPPQRTAYRLVVENLSSRVSWQVCTHYFIVFFFLQNYRTKPKISPKSPYLYPHYEYV